MSKYTPVYLESDEEITSAIDKIARSKSTDVALVSAKNGTLLQSLINLKLIAKEAKKTSKNIIIISPNKISQRIATQAGLQAYGNLNMAGGMPAPIKDEEPVDQLPIDEPIEKRAPLPEGIKVKQYQPPTGAQVETEPEEDVQDEPEEIADEPAEAIEPIDLKASDSEDDEEIDEPEAPAAPHHEVSAPIPVVAPVTHDEPARGGALPPIVSRGGVANYDISSIDIPWKWIGLIGGLILVLLIVSAIFVPKAKVSVVFPYEKVDGALEQTIKPDTTEAGVINGTMVVSEQTSTQAIATTGKKDIGTKATGQITITNKYIAADKTGKSQTFPAGTLVTDSKTKATFNINSAVTVGAVTYNSSNGQPVYPSQTVAVTASSPGTQGNVAAGSTFTLNGALANTTGTNSAAFSGGESKQVNVLSQEDYDKGVTTAKEALKAKAIEDIKAKSPDKRYFDEAIAEKITETTSDKKVGDQTDTANLALKITYSTVVFDEKTANTALEDKMKESMASGKQLIITQDKPIVLTYKSYDSEKGTLVIDSTAVGQAIDPVDKSKLASSIANKSVTKAKDIITNTYHAKTVDISVTPARWSRLPLLKNAIVIDFVFDEISGT